MSLDLVRNRIRDVPDFPKPGILFKDITPLLSDPTAFDACLDLLAERLHRHEVEALVGIESRGFIFGAALAARMKLPLELVRKPGKLPFKTHGVSYDLEYGSDRVEIHIDAVREGVRYAVVDDLIATGGTAAAAADLIELHKGHVACLVFVIELAFLEGRKRLGTRPIETLLTY